MMPTSRDADPSRRSTLSAYPAIDAGTGLGDGTSLRQLVRDEPLVVRPDWTLRDTLFALNHVGAQAAVVAELAEKPLGIVTLQHLVDAITLQKADLSDATYRFMTAAPITLPADASAHRARVTMTRARLSHLVLVEEDGRLCNLLAASNLPGFREGGADELVERINRADNVDSMARAAAAVRERGHALFANGMGVEALCQWMSGLNDLITIRVIELVVDEFDLPPVSWCWMVFGSEGRLEQAFATDQDNGLIFQPDNESDTPEIRRALVPFAQAVNRALDICGFMLCPGNIMAGNPNWCLSASEWRERFSTWMARPEPEALLHAAVFFDYRPLYGQDELVDQLHHWLRPQPARHARFLRLMTEHALGCTPSLGWFNKFAYDGGKRYPHTIDLKTHGARPFIDAARIWALQHGVWNTNTVERLRVTAPLAGRSTADMTASVEAFNVVQRLRIRRHLAGGTYDEINRIDPADLTASQRLALKEALKQAKLLQFGLRQAFLGQ